MDEAIHDILEHDTCCTLVPRQEIPSSHKSQRVHSRSRLHKDGIIQRFKSRFVVSVFSNPSYRLLSTLLLSNYEGYYFRLFLTLATVEKLKSLNTLM